MEASLAARRRFWSRPSRDGYGRGAVRRDDRPEAVPLDLVGVVAARRQPTGAGEHRFGKAAVGDHRSHTSVNPKGPWRSR
jgi:hypothetical protein